MMQMLMQFCNACYGKKCVMLRLYDQWCLFLIR